MTGPDHRIYLLGHKLPPEVVAVTFAKTSRSPEPFDEIARELTEDKSKKFHERWVIGFGHSSIAEHAVLHIAIENISRLATEVLESCRLCSYTEKSSRYQSFQHYYLSEKIKRSEFAGLYKKTCDELFTLYHSCLQKVRGLMEERYPRKPDEAERAYEARLRSRYSDVCRYLLPTAALANVGLTANARALEWLITKLLSNRLKEVRELGEELKRVALQETPTLVKYAEANEYLTSRFASSHTRTTQRAQGFQVPGSSSLNLEPVQLIDYDKEAEEKLVAALLYRFSDCSYSELLERARGMSQMERAKLIDEALTRTTGTPNTPNTRPGTRERGRARKRLGPHDRSLRELEHICYTFEIVVDQGAYRDLSRHRMMTQTVQPPTVDYGYAIPRAIEEAGLRKEYEEAIDQATAAYRKIYKRYPHEAAYLVTNAHNRRFLMTLNLRELYHLVALRSRPEGHFSYRRIALRIYELAREKHPSLLKYLPFADTQRAGTGEPPSSTELEREYFAEIAHKSGV